LTHNAVHQELQAVMARLRQLAQEGQREEFAGYLQQVLRRYGKDDEALMRLARFCQKQGWHGGFELFMTRLAARMPSSRAGILLTLGEHLLTAGRQRGFEHLRQAAAAALEHPDEEMLQRILRAAAQRLRERDDWEEAVEQFPPEVRGDLYLELAGQTASLLYAHVLQPRSISGLGFLASLSWAASKQAASAANIAWERAFKV